MGAGVEEGEIQEKAAGHPSVPQGTCTRLGHHLSSLDPGLPTLLCPLSPHCQSLIPSPGSTGPSCAPTVCQALCLRTCGNSFHLNHLFKSPISKCSHIWGTGC